MREIVIALLVVFHITCIAYNLYRFAAKRYVRAPKIRLEVRS